MSIFRIPRPIRGRSSEGAQVRGRPDGGRGDARPQGWDRSGDIRPVGAVAGVAPRTRAPAAQAAWSRRHYRGVTGGLWWRTCSRRHTARAFVTPRSGG